MKKKRNLALTGITLLCSLTLLACQQKQATQVLDEKVKQEQVQKEEIVYVVAELTEDGYVLIHGDHQHLEKGSVPYDAKFLKGTLLEDTNYQFNEKDVLYKVRTGYIIQVKGKVYYYPKKAGAGLVTLEEARKLTANNPEHDHHGHDHNHDHAHEEQKQSSTNLVGVAGIDRPTSDGFLLSDAKQISSKTDTGIIVEHNGHSHFIFYGDLKGSKWEYLIPAGADVTKKQENSASSQSFSQAGQDHYQFNPADIVAEDANGYTVRHGDHYHYILKQTVGGSVENPVHTDASRFASSKAVAPVMQNHLGTLPVSPIANAPVPAGANQATSVVSHQGIAGIDYPTNDGFLFDGSGLIGQNAVGLLIQHQGHIHVLRREQVAASKWAHLLENQASQVSPIRPLPDVVTTVVAKPVEKTEVVAVPSTSTQSQAASPAPVTPAEATVVDEVADKRNYLAQALGLPVGSITLLDTPQGQAFMYPHGDHDHLVLLKNIDLTKPFESEEEEHSPNSSSASETTSSSSEQPTSSSSTSSTTGSQATSEPEASTTTSPSLSEVAEAPNSAPVTPAETTVVDEVTNKRNYLAQALGLPISSITLLDTPQGQAFMYPHGDHDHVVLLKNIDLTKPFESEEDLERKIDYISKVYGVPKEAIRVSDTTFSFNDPSHAYDPTHVHPYVILRSMLIIPEVTGDPETDFEAELLAVAKRTGITPSKLIIRDKKFILPHGSHDHVLHIQAVDGIEPYLTNKLPAISGSYLEGEFDRASVDSQLESLRQVAAEKYGTSSKEYRRIKRALDDFASNLDDLVTNSTKGYLAMLEQFEKVHILKETTNNPEEQVDPLYQSILEQIRLLDTSNLPVNKDDLTSQLNQASQDKDRQALLNLEHLLQELKHFQDRPDITAMEYMDYLLSQLDQPYVPADLQERLASTLDRLFQATLGGNESIKPLDLSKELVDLKVALHLSKVANQTYPIQTSPASEKLQENRASMEAFVGDIREMFTRQMTFPEIVEKAEHETPVTSPSYVTDNQTYQELLTLLRQTNLTGTQTSQTAWVERINQASLKGDERELSRISHSLKEIQHFQDRAEIRLMEYMDYLLTHIDSPYLQAPTRQEAARLINQIYGLVVRRELATSPISLAEDLIASSIAVANDVKGQINQQLEMSDDYGIMQMNRLEMNMFVEGTRDFFVNPLSLPEEVLVKAGQTSPVPAIEEGVGAASPTSQDRPESSSSPIHDHESGSKEASPSSLSQAVEENPSSETGSSSEQAISSTELVEAEVVAPTNSDVLVSEESASSDGSKPTEVQEIPSVTDETTSGPVSEPTDTAVEEQALPSESAEEEDVELSDEDLEWLSDIFGEFTGSTSEEESEDIGLTWKPIGNIEGWFE
ncbi:TPA: pneumococcal-type histidine triad protein [Streptococcus suis]|nr:pneumococcal-type histidine triad protein [Streptococcus suis]